MTETDYTTARIRRLELELLQRDARIRELEAQLYAAQSQASA